MLLYRSLTRIFDQDMLVFNRQYIIADQHIYTAFSVKKDSLDLLP